jgi:hypothetical protein
MHKRTFDDDRLRDLAGPARDAGVNSTEFATFHEAVMSGPFVNMAWRAGIGRHSADFDDLYSAASEAVLSATCDWDPGSEKDLIKYVLRAVRNAVSKAVTEARTWETGHDNKRHLGRLRVTRGDLRISLRREPSASEIAEALCADVAARFVENHPEAGPAEIEAHLVKNGYARLRSNLDWAARLDGVGRLDAPIGDDGLTFGDTVAAHDAGDDSFADFAAVAEWAAGGADLLRAAELHGAAGAARERGDRDEAEELSEVLSGGGRAPSIAARRVRESMATPQALFVAFDAELSSRIDEVGDTAVPAAEDPISRLCLAGT